MVAAAVLAGGPGTPVSAQDAAQNIRAVEVRIHPGGAAAFEAFLARYKEAVTASEPDRIWLVSTNAIGPVTTYTIAEPLPTFEARDRTAADPLAAMVEALQPAERAAATESLGSVVSTTDSRAWIARADLSRPPDPGRRVVGFTVIFIDVKPGAEDAFEAYMKSLVEASERLEDGNWAASTGAPGAPADYMVTQPIYQWSDLDNPGVRTLRQRLIEVYGEQDGAKRYADGAAAIENLTSALIRSRPDLSRLPD